MRCISCNCIQIPPTPLYERGSRLNLICVPYNAVENDLIEGDKQLN